MSMVSEGIGREEIMERLHSFRSTDLDWKSGRTFAYVFDAGREAESVCKQAYLEFISENGLDPTAYPSLLRLENEVVGVALDHLGGGEKSGGTFTSGGTESILLAVKTARDRARAVRGIERPEIVLPVTAHAAFHKAAHYFGLDPVLVDVNPDTFRADPEAMRQAISNRTALLVASAPSYAHGVIDPIEDIAAIAKKRDLPFHVDACIGGWLLPYFRRLGEAVPPFDLSVPGVTSISMDFHKYAYAAKGASVVLYADASWRKHQYFTCTDWTGYTLINASVQSTKSGGPLAGTYAVLNYLGDEGYLEIAGKLRDAVQRLIDGIASIEGLRILGKPDMSLLAIGADGVNLFHIVDEMKLRGWYVQPQLSYRHYERNIHLSVHPGNVHAVDAFLAALTESVEAARRLPAADLTAQLGGAVGDLAANLDQLGPEAFGPIMQMVGVVDGKLPERMAGINELLDALPPAARGAVLSGFLQQLFTPAR